MTQEAEKRAATTTRTETSTEDKVVASKSGRGCLPLVLVILLLVLGPRSHNAGHLLLASGAPEPRQQQVAHLQNGLADQRASSALVSQDSMRAAGSLELAPFGGAGGQFYLPSGSPAGVANSKRARKMSAFMPMRGRRAGWGAPRAWTWPHGREDEDDTRLLDELAADGELQMASGQRFGPLVANIPSGFLVQHLQHRSKQQRQQQAEQPDEGVLMEAKLRRAFHPMRGKKSMQIGESDATMDVGDSQSAPDVLDWLTNAEN